jgi:UDP-N-acetylmuramyl pentapeptide phosphotransferase/UDP-N-acetylglucosamine-1-phosphate transferase
MDSPPLVIVASFGSEFAAIAVVAAGVSLGVCGLMLALHRFWGIGGDSHLGDKPQRFHISSVSRLGGVGVFVGFCISLLFWDGGLELGGGVLLCALPVFLVGVGEDLTGRISPRWRLGVAGGAALLGALWLGAVLSLPFGGSWGVWHKVLSVVFTVLCVAGVTHSFNIIDGFNGLASGVGMIVLAALGWLALMFGDSALCNICWGMAAAVFGFFLLNYPGGKLFLGDGGAYVLGFTIAMCSVLLVVRHPEGSWFLPLLLVIYPVTETLFSMWRRLSRGQSAGEPDARHLHSLVHKRLNRWWRRSHRHEAWRNSLTSTFFWMLTLATVLPALIFWDNSAVLIGLASGFVMAFVWFYSRLVRFRVPQWMVLVGGQQDSQLEFGFVGEHSETRKPPDGVSFRSELNGASVNGKVNGHQAEINGRNGIAVKGTRERQEQIEFRNNF